MSKLEVDTIAPQSGTTVTLGESGDTITVPSGATLDTSNSTVTLPDGSVSNAKLANSSITLNGNSVSLGGSASIASGMFRNIIINGDMSIAQRGTSTSGVTTTDGYYACDRFYTQTDTGTWTISQSTDTPSGQGFSKSLKLDCTSAGTSNADEVGIRYKVEGQNVQYLKYGTSSADSLTLSFWIKTNLTGTYTVAFKNVSSVQERIVSFEYTVSSANTWEKKTITLPGDTSQALENTNNSEFEIYWYFSAAFGTGVTNTWQNYSSNFLSNGSLPGLGGSTDDEVYITGVQLEAGTTASDFEFLPYDVNLQRCQRYYELCDGNRVVGTSYSSTLYCNQIRFSVTKRASPTITIQNNTTTFTVFYNGGFDASQTWNTDTQNTDYFNINMTNTRATGFIGPGSDLFIANSEL